MLIAIAYSDVDVDANANSTRQFYCSLGFSEHRGRLYLQSRIVKRCFDEVPGNS